MYGRCEVWACVCRVCVGWVRVDGLSSPPPHIIPSSRRIKEVTRNTKRGDNGDVLE